MAMEPAASDPNDRPTRKLGHVILVDINDNPNDATHPTVVSPGTGTLWDVSDRAARLIGQVAIRDSNGHLINVVRAGDAVTLGTDGMMPAAGSDYGGTPAYRVLKVDSSGQLYADIIDRAARLLGKAGIQVAGADVNAGNPVPTSSAIVKTQDTTSVPSSARTTNGNSADIDVSTKGEVTVFWNISAITGTNPTLQLFLEVKDPISGTYTTLQSTTSQNSVTNGLLPSGLDGSTIRLRWVISGVTPSVTFSAAFLFKS